MNDNDKPPIIRSSRKMLCCVFFVACGYSVCAQTGLRSLLETAATNYPTIAARRAEADAAQASIQLEKNTLLPSLDAAYQANYATYNNITGMNYPGQLIPISGPPSTENFDDLVPGSAASLLFTWSPISFGQRSASIDYQQKRYARELAAVEDELLRVQFAVAYHYLEIAATRELIAAFQKNVERNAFNLSQVATLVAAGIRPAADSLTFRGELSKSRTELFRLENLLVAQQLQLSELLAVEGIVVTTERERFFEALPTLPPPPADTLISPALKMAQSALGASEARLRQLKRAWVPQLEFWGTAYARGSGIDFDGTVDKTEGWSFSRYNYGAGLQLVFPILDLTRTRLRSRQQEAFTRSSAGALRQTELALRRQEAAAINDMNTALKVAGEVPVQLAASEAAYQAFQTRYRSGLIDYTGLLQAQYDVLNAEAGLKNAYVSAWKALLNLAVIRGDLNIFLGQVD